MAGGSGYLFHQSSQKLLPARSPPDGGAPVGSEGPVSIISPVAEWYSRVIRDSRPANIGHSPKTIPQKPTIGKGLTLATPLSSRTTDGIEAHGGSLNKNGPVVAGGMLYVESGNFVGMPGNALLAFSIDGK